MDSFTSQKSIEQAKELYAQGYSCSQSVLAAFCGSYGLDQTVALRLAAAFGGGISRSGQICGAASGAVMVLGLAHGSFQPTDKAAKEGMYALGREFLERFNNRMGSLDCSGLLGVELGTPEGLEQARANGLFETVCPGAVSAAAVILAGLLAQQSQITPGLEEN
jgi:C_GCAxxG_C_C family probable redox protein